MEEIRRLAKERERESEGILKKRRKVVSESTLIMSNRLVLETHQ